MAFSASATSTRLVGAEELEGGAEGGSAGRGQKGIEGGCAQGARGAGLLALSFEVRHPAASRPAELLRG